MDEEDFFILFLWTTVLLGTSLSREGICLFVDLWEAQPCLWDPEC